MKGLRQALIWSKKHIRRKRTLQKIRKLCRRAAQFKVAYQFPMAHRTSNLVDRLMNHQDRLLYRTDLGSLEGGGYELADIIR